MQKKLLIKLIRFMSVQCLLFVIIQAVTMQFIIAENLHGQNLKDTKVTLRLKKERLTEIFKVIEDKTDFSFVYPEEVRNNRSTFSLSTENESLESILRTLRAKAKLKFKVSNYTITAAFDPKMLAYPKKTLPVPVDSIIVTGIVHDEQGNPLPGVNMLIKGTGTGTVTNADGKYSLPLTDDAILVFSFIGYTTQEVAVNGRSTIDVVMAEDVQRLEEVVVVGYGTQKKVNLTGAVSSVSSKRLENRPIVSVGQGLQGVIPNLNIDIRNGDPTNEANFNIRGFESINGGEPLILVDGVPMDLERINPNDIESVSVLKDASASAIYGARAAFGVILVETKKGKEGKVNVSFSTQQSLAKPIWFLDVVTDPYKYVQAINEASIRTNGVPQYDKEFVEGTKKWAENPTDENAWEVVNGGLRFYGNSDYQNKIITDFAPQNRYDLTISGGSERATYYTSVSYLNKDGYIRNDEKNEKYKRYNILMKADFKINDWISIDQKIVFNAQNSDKPHNYQRSAYINSVARQAPISKIEFPDLPYYIEPGDREKYEQYIGMYFGDGTNWFPYLEEGGRTTFTTDDTWLTQGIELSPLNGLRIRGNFSYRTYKRDYQDVASKVEVIDGGGLQPVEVNYGFSGNDYIENQFNRRQYYVLNTYAEYEIESNSNHYLKAMVGFNQEWGQNNFAGAQANALITPIITDLNATTGTQQTFGSKNHVALRGAFYRLNYIYKDKYLLEFNGRYDGTSRFPKESRFGFFPSVSVGWRVSEESFMDLTNNWVDNLKLRASYGELGNQLLGNNYYPYISSMRAGTAPYIFTSGAAPYISPAGLVSPSLAWETVATQNIGVDFTILNQRLDVSFDTYIRDTKDMLMSVLYPEVLGTTAPRENAADLRTKGWELSVAWRSKIGQDWKYDISIALSDNQSEITKYENPSGNFSDHYVGKKIGEIWGFETVGIFQYDDDVASAPDQSQIGANWRAGDIQYADLNDDGRITRGNQTLENPGDLTIIGNSSPRYSFGINPSVSYKNWTLNVFFQGLFRDHLPSLTAWAAFYPYRSSIVENWYLTETWSEDNRDAYFPAPHIATNDTKNYQPQSRYVQNASYIRLKNLTLNYNLPQNFIGKVGLSSAQIYFAGMNLWEYTKMHKPLDPESIYTTDQEYYKQRIYALGIEVNF